MSGARTRMINDWKKRSYASNLKVAQQQFNRMVRLEAADDNGLCTCIVTNQKHLFKNIDAGHFISANRAATRFDERNVHPQSKGSNQFDTTNDSLIFYTLWMGEKYGRSVVDELIRLSRTQKKWTCEEIVDLRLGWAQRIRFQEERLGIA